MKTVHKEGKKLAGLWVVHYCNGRAVSDRFTVTDLPEEVTCKRCLAKMAAVRVEAVKAFEAMPKEG